MNYFELFGFEVSPVIDTRLLTQRYISLQREAHPDFYTQELTDQQEMAMNKSADINKAYKIFKHEDETLAYFLKVKSVLAEGEKFELPPDFLMEMMEINEALTDEPENGRALAEEFQKHLQEAIQKQVKGWEQDKENAKLLDNLKSLYFRKKYLNRILDRLGD